MDELGNEERARLYERFGRTYAAGEAIYAEGDPADLCFLVQEGRVRVFKRIRDAERSLTVLRTVSSHWGPLAAGHQPGDLGTVVSPSAVDQIGCAESSGVQAATLSQPRLLARFSAGVSQPSAW
jgi:CRP-like cAMP-binding protein